jgi:hypothetical protein
MSNKLEWGKFHIGGSWSYNDAIKFPNKIEAEILKDGDIVEIRWPTGDQEHKVRVSKAPSITVSDMGNPWSCPVTHAFIDVQINGLNVPLRVIDLSVDARIVERK